MDDYNHSLPRFDPSIKNSQLLARGGLISFFGGMFNKAVSFVLEVILARAMGTKAYGIYALSFNISRMISSFAHLGLTRGLEKFGSIYRTLGEGRKLKGLFKISHILVLCIGGGTALLFSMNAKFIANWFNEPGMEAPFQIGAWIILPTVILVISGGFLRSQLKIFEDTVFRNAVRPLISLILILVLGKFFSLDDRNALLAMFVGFSLAAALSIVYSLNAFPRGYFGVSPEYRTKEWIRFSVPTLLAAVTYMLVRQTSRILLGKFSATQLVGQFSAALLITDNLVFLLQALLPIFTPLIAELFEQKDHVELQKVIKAAFRWSFTLSFPLFLIIWFLGEEVLTLFGQQYRAAYPVLVVLSLGQLINIATGPVGMVIQMIGKQDYDVINGVVAVLTNLIIGLIWIPRYGILGAGAAASLSLVIVHLARLIEMRIFLGIWPYSLSNIKVIMAAAIASFAFLGMGILVDITSILLRVLAGGSLITLTFFIAVLILGIEESDRDLFKRAYRRVLIRKSP
jgi:O-antigen/teichoic acid export membrane protein